jgi:cell division protein FtsL
MSFRKNLLCMLAALVLGAIGLAAALYHQREFDWLDEVLQVSSRQHGPLSC